MGDERILALLGKLDRAMERRDEAIEELVRLSVGELVVVVPRRPSYPLSVHAKVGRRIPLTPLLVWLKHIYARFSSYGARLKEVTLDEVVLSRDGLTLVTTWHYEGHADVKARGREYYHMPFGTGLLLGYLAVITQLLDEDIIDRLIGEVERESGEAREALEQLKNLVAVLKLAYR